MAVVSKGGGVCETCGSSIETTNSGDLGCMVCLFDAALDSDSEESEGAFASPSDQFGAYTIEHRVDGSAWELGRGAMGVTYRAIDKVLDRPVALKIVNTKLGSRSADARERFMREARAAAALRHPNVATVYHFGVREETGQFFYAMELIEGETLEERVRRLGPLNVSTTIDIALQVAAALAAAEERGLVHRDLKPGNLMLIGGTDNEVSTVKVIDFGVAKAVAEKTNRNGAHAWRLRRHACVRQSGAIHQCACGRALRHLLVRRNALVFAHWLTCLSLVRALKKSVKPTNQNHCRSSN